MPTEIVATITRYKLCATPGSNQRFAWYWGYNLHMSTCSACAGSKLGDKCVGHAFGRHPLVSIRQWAKSHGATKIVETWKLPAVVV